MQRRDAFLGVLALIALWQLLAWAVQQPILPPPGQVLLVFLQQLPGELGRHILVSAGRVIASIALAVALAVPAGLGLGQIKALNRIFAPLIYVVYPIPKIVFLPVIFILFRAGELSRIILITFFLFFQVLVLVRDEAAGLRPELIQSVRSLGAGRRALFRFVYLPASLPAVLSALRISVGTAIAVLYISEGYATSSGLGYYIVTESWGRLAYTEMYAGVVAMSLLGLALYFVVDALDRRLCPWHVAT